MVVYVLRGSATLRRCAVAPGREDLGEGPSGWRIAFVL